MRWTEADRASLQAAVDGRPSTMSKRQAIRAWSRENGRSIPAAKAQLERLAKSSPTAAPPTAAPPTAAPPTAAPPTAAPPTADGWPAIDDVQRTISPPAAALTDAGAEESTKALGDAIVAHSQRLADVLDDAGVALTPSEGTILAGLLRPHLGGPGGPGGLPDGMSPWVPAAVIIVPRLVPALVKGVGRLFAALRARQGRQAEDQALSPEPGRVIEPQDSEWKW